MVQQLQKYVVSLHTCTLAKAVERSTNTVMTFSFTWHALSIDWTLVFVLVEFMVNQHNKGHIASKIYLKGYSGLRLEEFDTCGVRNLKEDYKSCRLNFMKQSLNLRPKILGKKGGETGVKIHKQRLHDF